MRIAIDMRMAGTGEGIGRYVEELVKHLARIDSQNQYFLLTEKKYQLPVTNYQFQIVPVTSAYYSFAEQTKFISELNKLHLDLVHFASFNAPILYRGKFVVTIHDLIHHHFPGRKKSRFFHRAAYRAVVRSTVKRAQKVITVSESTKHDLQKLYTLPDDWFAVIYEGVDERFKTKQTTEKINEVMAKYEIKKPYLLFVGVWRQYKNLPALARAFDILKEKYQADLSLVLAGKIDPFYPEIKNQVFSAKHKQDIRALGFVPDEDLPALYQGAAAFVLPSLIEGFGLIGVEAQASGIPVAASDIRSLREVLGDGAIFFNPKNPDKMAETIYQILSKPDLAKTLAEQGRQNANKYDWQKTAEKTLNVYQQVL